MFTDNVRIETVKTERLRMSCLFAGESTSRPVILLHGNVSSNVFWRETAAALAKDYWVIAPDLRGYGQTEEAEIDATRGLRDWSDDVFSLVTALKLTQPVRLIGWSMGGGIAMQYAIDHAPTVASMALINPVSPYGFGGTKDEAGTPCFDNFAGSGGGTANPQFVELLRTGERGEDDPNSPRNVLNQFYVKPPFRAAADQEEQFVMSMLTTRIGPGFYPGTFTACEEWPGVAPGDKGINNAMSPKYLDLSGFADISAKFPVLWIRGADDMIVSDQSLLDFGFLGKLGYVEGWPGDEVCPAQPMVTQTRSVFNKYKENGGSFEEFIMENTGHSPHIENFSVYLNKLRSFLLT